MAASALLLTQNVQIRSRPRARAAIGAGWWVTRPGANSSHLPFRFLPGEGFPKTPLGTRLAPEGNRLLLPGYRGARQDIPGDDRADDWLKVVRIVVPGGGKRQGSTGPGTIFRQAGKQRALGSLKATIMGTISTQRGGWSRGRGSDWPIRKGTGDSGIWDAYTAPEARSHMEPN